MLSISDDTLFPVELDLSNTTWSDKIRNKVHEEFNDLLRKLQFHRKAYTYLRNWYIDGRAYFYIEYGKKRGEGIKQIIELDPVRTKKIISMENGEEKTTWVYQDINLAQNLFEIPPENIIEVNSGLMDDEHQIWVSNLYDAYVPLNQLSGIEDALVIYRLSRAPERRVFYVDVGELPKSKAEAYMKDLIRNYRNKMEYDRDTGTIKEQVRHSSLLDDIWLPRRSGSQGTQVSTIQGNTGFLNNVSDLDYFTKKLFRSLRVPFSRFIEGENRGVSFGRATEISRDELKYAKFIQRLRGQFNTLFYLLLKYQCKLKNILNEKEIVDDRENIIFKWNNETMFSEFKALDMVQERLTVLSSIMPYVGRLYSLEWVRKNILHMNDDEMRDMLEQMKKEDKDYVRLGILPAEVTGLDGEMHTIDDPSNPMDSPIDGIDDLDKEKQDMHDFNRTHDKNGNGLNDKDFQAVYPFSSNRDHWK